MERVKLCSSRKGNAKPLGRQKKKCSFLTKQVQHICKKATGKLSSIKDA
jgi:hypothetical protein